MRKLFLLLFVVFSVFSSFSQITWGYVDVTTQNETSSPIEICLGDSIYLSATSQEADTLMGNDFNDGTLGEGWTSSSTPIFGNPCEDIVDGDGYPDDEWDHDPLGPTVDGSDACWIGINYDQPRDLTTAEFDVTQACTICFDFAMGIENSLTGSSCEGPDEMDEGVSLQFSTNGGSSWEDIIYFCPEGDLVPHNNWIGTNITTNETFGGFTTWQNYCFNVPADAATDATMFQWHQDEVTANDMDHWGIDNVVISCPTPNDVVWDNDGNFISDEYTPGWIIPTESTTINATISDDTDSDLASFDVVVYPPPVFQVNMDTIFCTQSSPVAMSCLPSPGIFFGPGVIGAYPNPDYTFDPAAAGIGDHTISYYWIQFNAAGNDILCEYDTSFVIHVTDGPSANFTVVSPICANDSSLITYTGTGSANANYTWNFNGMTVLSGTNAGPYQVTSSTAGTYTILLDVEEGGCTAQHTETIEVSASPIANAGTDVFTCDNTTIITATGGGTYAWNNSIGAGASHTVSPTTSTEYIVTVTNSIGCSDIDTVIINLGSMAFDTTIINTSCFGSDDGSINLTLNGEAPYTINWDNGATTGILNNLTAGNYTITASDNAGCELINTFIVSQPSEIQIATTVTNSLCFGTADGYINTTVTGGNGNYSYLWNNTQTTANITNLLADTYSLTVTDTNNCTSTHTTIVNEPIQLTTVANPTNISCFGLNDGEINLDITGGTPPYAYTWSNGEHNEDIDSLINNIYFVTVIDANNCTAIDTGEVTEPFEITINENSNSILCYGDETGIIDISVAGGVTPYTYNWNNQSITEDINNVPVGTYSVTVTDNSGCSKTEYVTLNQPDKLITSLPSNYTHCNHNTNLEVSVEGGISSYSYQWNTGTLTDNINYQTNSTQTYTVTVTDNNGCTSSNEITITINSINLDVYANKDTVCPGDPVLVTTNIQGGIPPYTIYDNNEISTFPVIIYPNGENAYNLTAVDACGNTDIASVSVNTYPITPISFNADILQGCSPLKVHFNHYNYSNKFNYIWNFDDINENNYSNAINPIHTFTESGLYDISVQITDGNGCKNQHVIQNMIEVYPKPEAHFEATPEVVSFINSSIDFDNYSENNYNNYWFFDDEDQSNLTNPTHEYSTAGVYYPMLVVETDKGCLDTAIHKIEVQDEFIIYVPTAFSPDGDNINDGFKAVGHGIDLDNYFIAVYDRWGEQIWASTDLNQEWQATAKNGSKIVQNGSYKWIVVCNDFNGVEHTKSGNVTVIR